MAPDQLGRPGQDYVRYAGLGFQFAATLVLFSLGGWWLDGKLGSSPWLLLLGVLLGFGGGMLSLVKKVPGATGGSKDPTTDR
ncbi:MAG: AtpZ/AtpI family protein [Planctomycetota bacterium]